MTPRRSTDGARRPAIAPARRPAIAPARRPAIARARARSRGFTLVELMMATTAGLIVSAAAFLLAKNASAVFQEETRITGAQLSASLGLQRLATDLGRAGFLSTPNIQNDPFVCKETGSWTPLIAGLQAVSIEEQGSLTAHGPDLTQSLTNGFRPDRIRIAASFDSAEQLPVRTIEGGGTKTIYLQTQVPQLQRVCQGETLANCKPRLDSIFKQDRILRILTGSGHQVFALVDSVAVAGGELAIKLQPAPTVPTVEQNPMGISVNCRDNCWVNAISVVQYELQALDADPSYGPLVAPIAAAATGDDGRTELTRVELDKNGLPLPDTLELVAEFAVDLKFGITFIDAATSTVTDVPIPNPPNSLIYNTPPERIRSVHVRLSTRARAPDRPADLAAGPDGRRHRFGIPVGGKTVFARMRTLYSEVALQNVVKGLW